MRSVAAFLLLFMFALTMPLRAQDLSGKIESQSDISKLLKSTGTLFVREYHNLPDIVTMSTANINCRVLILRDLLSKASMKDKTQVGLAFGVKEEYSERTAFLDLDEAQGLLASLKKLTYEGQAILETPIVAEKPGNERSVEILYTTKENVTLGAFMYQGSVTFGLKVSSLADWAVLTRKGASTLEANLKLVAEMAAEASK